MRRGMRDARRAMRGLGSTIAARLRLPFALVVLVAAACTEIGSDPQAAVAIELERLPVPAVVVGDTLRDSTGAVVMPTARAINVNNDEIAGAPIRYLALDTGVVSVDSTTGVIVGKRVGTTPIIATIQGLQSERITVIVTQRPDTAYGLDSLRRTMQFSLTSPTAASSGPLRVFVGHDTTILGVDTAVAVPSYLVRYAILFPADGSVSDTDTTKVVLANDLGRPSTVDTTDASGIASRAVRISTAVSTIPDSVIVEARVSYPDTTSVAGTPVRFVIRILGVP
jgi:hypothetical protein